MSRRPTTDSLAAEEWAGAMGQKWLANAARFEGMLAPIGQVLISRAAFSPGERVVDVGCGAGGTSIAIARQVRSLGSVLGVDISRHLVAGAARRAQAERVDNVSFRCADATTVSLDGPRFDRLFSRFGLMFFPDARAAFANLHTLVRAGGRADFSVWAPARENPWIVQVMGIIGRHVELPPPVPRAPGPFALDDAGYLRELLDNGGFRAMRIDSWEGNQPVGGPGAAPQEATAFVMDAMSFGQVLEESGPGVRAKVEGELSELFARNHGPEGILMAGKAYLVSAVA
jgi:SAM-dependent methyltransferase